MFPYEETDDQLSAIEDTKKDMESRKIMDRLICGDVGYGKTEIALRAAFKAVQEGHVYVTSPDFTQSTAAIASIIADMNTIFTSDDPEVTTDHLIRLS